MATHEDVVTHVKRANERFYRAFESLDIQLMSAVWVHAERARCVHPGWELLEGWHTICQSWQAIFANTAYMHFVLTDVVVQVYDQVAWVTCTENLRDAPDTVQVTRLLATNVYEHVDDDWRIVHHHASPILRPMPDLEGLGLEDFN